MVGWVQGRRKGRVGRENVPLVDGRISPRKKEGDGWMGPTKKEGEGRREGGKRE